MGWITNHVQELQAISGLTIVLLTIALIILNAVYVHANRATMRLMDADVRFRLKPIPQVGVSVAFPWNASGGQEWTIMVRCEHAPIVLTACEFHFHVGNGKQFNSFHSMNGKTVTETQSNQFTYAIEMPAPPQSWLLDLHYRDLSGMLHYLTTFNERGFFSESAPVDAHAWGNRIRFWLRRRQARKKLGFM